MIIAASKAIGRIANLDTLLDIEGDVSVGWGRKPSGFRAQAVAKRRGIDCLLLEDGFLRSIRRDDPPLSLLADPIGVYYDASTPSLIEQWTASPLDPDAADRARALMALWRSAEVSKYNDAPVYRGTLPDHYVVIVDQTFGDESVRYGGAGPSTFERMLDTALREHPRHVAVVKVHPDIFSRRKRGYFDVSALTSDPRVMVVAESCHPVTLIRDASAVYTVTSQMGFEALLWRKPVRTFGMPFYAGWGLTDDDRPAPDRRKPASIEQLVHAALIAAPSYLDPTTGRRCTPEIAIAHVAAERKRLMLAESPPFASGRSKTLLSRITNALGR